MASGNNSKMIKAIIDSRSWWRENCHPVQPSNFYWKIKLKQVNFNFFNKFSKQKRMLNRFRHYPELAKKDNLYRNLWYYCRDHNLKLNSITPLTFCFRVQESSIDSDLQEFAKVFLSQATKVDPEKVPFKIDKAGRKIYHDFGVTFNNEGALKENQYRNSIASQIDFTDKVFFSGENLWILKPCCLSKGRGLEMITNLAELGSLIKQFVNGYTIKDFQDLGQGDDRDEIEDQEEEKMGSPKKRKGFFHKTGTEDRKVEEKKGKSNEMKFYSFIIQKYIEKPLLFKSRKFDIRFYALVHNNELFVCR